MGSSILSYDGSDPSDISTQVLTMTNPAGKVLYVCCLGSVDETGVTKKIAAEFTEQILASNPPAPQKSSGGGTGFSARSIRGVLKLGIILIVFVGFLAKKFFGRLLNR